MTQTDADPEATYLAQRLDDQIGWYDAKAGRNQSAYKTMRVIEIVAATAIPFLAGYSDRHALIPLAIGALGLLVAVLAGLMGLFRFQENWTEYRATAEALKQEKYLYLGRAGPYAGEDRFAQLVQRVEGLIKSETTNWASAMRAAGDAVEAERKARATT